jgi:protein required for attachment to host cells
MQDMRRPLWVLVADESRARILNWPGHGHDLEPVDELTDAAARADRADLRRDAYGRRAGGDQRMGGNTTSSASDDELHREAAGFARRVAQWLADAQMKGHFEALRIVAAPRFLGLLRKALPPAVAQRVTDDAPQDLVQLNQRELTVRLFSAEAAAGPH